MRKPEGLLKTDIYDKKYIFDHIHLLLRCLDEDYYYSGGFKICYSEINHIEVEDEVYTSKALVVVCKLMKDEKVIGYDRMVAQDFICLRAKIDEKTKIVKKL